MSKRFDGGAKAHVSVFRVARGKLKVVKRGFVQIAIVSQQPINSE